MSELLVELVINLTRARMQIKLLEYKAILKQSKKNDNRESGALQAGYNKALDDLDKVFMSIVEM